MVLAIIVLMSSVAYEGRHKNKKTREEKEKKANKHKHKLI